MTLGMDPESPIHYPSDISRGQAASVQIQLLFSAQVTWQHMYFPGGLVGEMYPPISPWESAFVFLPTLVLTKDENVEETSDMYMSVCEVPDSYLSTELALGPCAEEVARAFN